MNTKFFNFSLYLLISSILFSIAVCGQEDRNQRAEWKFITKAPIFSSPLVENNHVFIGSLDSNFYCLDLVNGTLIWKMKTNGQIRSTAKSAGKNVLFFCGDGKLYALEKTSGTIVWTFQTKDKMHDPFDYYQSSPLILDEEVYFGSGDGNIYSLNTTTGKQTWSFATKGEVHSTLAHYSGKIYANSFDGNTYALNKKDGSLVWKFKSVGHRYFPKGEMQFSPVVVNGLVIVSGRDYNLYALDAEKGYSHWNKVFTRGWAPVITPSPKDDSLLYVGTSDDYLLLCLNSLSGREMWKANLKFNIFGACTFNGDTGYTSTLMGKCYAFNGKTGEILKIYTSETYLAHRLDYFKEDDTFRDDIYSILHSNEDLIEAEYKVGGFYSTPAIASEYLLLSSTDGSIYCYKR